MTPSYRSSSENMSTIAQHIYKISVIRLALVQISPCGTQLYDAHRRSHHLHMSYGFLLVREYATSLESVPSGYSWDVKKMTTEGYSCRCVMYKYHRERSLVCTVITAFLSNATQTLGFPPQCTVFPYQSFSLLSPSARLFPWNTLQTLGVGRFPSCPSARSSTMSSR